MSEKQEEIVKTDDSCAIFKDIRFFVSGEVDEKVIDVLKNGGAERLNYFSDYVTHLIVGESPEENDIVDATDVYEVPALTPKWVFMCAALKRLVTTKPYLYSHDQKLFSNYVFCFSNIKQDRNYLWSLITYNGGTVQLNLSRNCHFLIAVETDGIKYKKAESLGPELIKIVTPDWVVESVKNMSLADPSLFHPKLINWPKPVKQDSTTAITGFEPEQMEAIGKTEEQAISDSTQALLDKLKQRMPWNQPNTPQTMSSSDPIAPPNVVAPSFLQKTSQQQPPNQSSKLPQSPVPVGLPSVPKSPSSSLPATLASQQIPRSVVHHAPNQPMNFQQSQQSHPLSIARIVGQQQPRQGIQQIRGQLGQSQLHQQLLQQRMQLQNQQVIQRTPGGQIPLQQQQVLQQQLVQGQLNQRQILQNQLSQNQINPQVNQSQQQILQNQQIGQTPHLSQLSQQQLAQLQQQHLQLKQQQLVQNQQIQLNQQQSQLNQNIALSNQQHLITNQVLHQQQNHSNQQNQQTSPQQSTQITQGQGFIQHNVNQHIASSHAQQLLHKQQFVNQQTTSGQQQVSTAQQQLMQTQTNIMAQQSQQLIGSGFKQNQIVNQDIQQQSNITQQQQNVNQQLNVHTLNQQLSTQNLGQQLNQQQLTQQATQQSQLEQLNQELNQQINQQSQINQQQLNQQIQMKQHSSPPTQQQIVQSPINQQLISQNQLNQQSQQLCQQQILQTQLNQQQLGQQSQLNQQLIHQQGQMNQISQASQLNQQITQNHLNSPQMGQQNPLNQQNQLNQQLLEDIQALNQQLQQQSVGQQNIQQQQQLQRQSLQQLQGLKQQQALQQQPNIQQGISQGLQQQVINQQTLHQQQQSLNQQAIQQGLNQQNLQGLNQSSLQQQALNQQNLQQQQQLNQVVRSQFQQQSPQQQQQAGGISQQILINQTSPQNQPQRAQIAQHLWGQQQGQQIIRHPVSVVQQGAPRVQWTTNQGGTVPQRQFIQLDARTHNQLQKMPPEEQALFVAKLQRQRQQLIKQVQQRGGGGGHILIRGNVPPGLTAQQQVQWLQQQAKQQGIVLPPSIQQQQPVGPGGSPVATPLVGQLPSQQPVPGAPGLSPINQGPPQPPPPQFAAANADQNQQQQLQLRQYRLQQLQLQREQAQKNHLTQQQGGITQQAVARPINQQHLADSTTNPQVPDASMHPLVVNPKTKTALANMLSIKLQSGGSSMGAQRPDAIAEPSAAGTLRLMTAQHNAALNSKPQEIIALQRRTISGPNGEIIKAQQLPLSSTSEPPKLQFTQKPSLPLQHRPGPFYGHNPNLKLPPDLFLLGCIFVVVEMENYLEETIPGWRQKIEKHGGEIEKQYCSRVTHVLCETQRHGVVMQALRDCKRCVTIVWLNDVMQRKQVLPPWTALHLPNIYLDTAPASKHLISISGFEGNDRNRVKRMIKYTGAKCTTYFSKHNTLLISAKSDCKKSQYAKKWQIPVVNVQWLTDIMLGHFTAMNQMENQIYQQFPNPPNFSFDPKLVPNLMMAWKAPINISQESYERVKRSASPVMLPKKYKKPKTETDENGNISQEQVSNSTHKILFSMFPRDNELTKMIGEIGGSVAKDHKNFTHLVMPHLARSNKLFFAIAKEAYVVSEQWLKDSHDAKKFLPETSYSLSTKEFNMMYKCDFDQTLQTRNRCKLLEGKFFYVTPSVVPSKKIVSELIQCSGGVVERVRRSSAQIEATSINSPYSYFIITHENDLHLVADLLKNKKDKMKIVCNVELIFSAILKQTFEVEPYAVCVL
nr:unnamed protein product [Callosobruchus chinensis]